MQNILCQTKTKQSHLKEKAFIGLLWGMALAVSVLILSIFLTLFFQSRLSLQSFGLSFLLSDIWNPVTQEFGALPFLVGTLLTSLLALLISLPFSIAISIYLGHFLKYRKQGAFLKVLIELLAGIPSVIYGFWALLVLVPWVRQFESLIGVTPYGVGILSAALVLTFMIVPFSAMLGRDVVALVPEELKEAALSLGATPYEMIKTIVLPHARSGLYAGFFISFGRAISETIAVTMVIGNVNRLPESIFSPGNTFASVLANEFSHSAQGLYTASLYECALILLVLTAVVSFVGRKIVRKMGS